MPCAQLANTQLCLKESEHSSVNGEGNWFQNVDNKIIFRLIKRLKMAQNFDNKKPYFQIADCFLHFIKQNSEDSDCAAEHNRTATQLNCGNRFLVIKNAW